MGRAIAGVVGMVVGVVGDVVPTDAAAGLARHSGVRS
jgi:hypothetical protein